MSVRVILILILPLLKGQQLSIICFHRETCSLFQFCLNIKTHDHLAIAGITISRFIVNPLFDVKDKENKFLPENYWHNITKFNNYENTGFVEFGYNFSPFIGFDGKTSLNFANTSAQPDLSMSTRLIYSPLSLFDSHLKYSLASRSATLVEKIYLSSRAIIW